MRRVSTVQGRTAIALAVALTAALMTAVAPAVAGAASVAALAWPVPPTATTQPAARGAGLADVSCADATHCVAVGSRTGGGTTSPLAVVDQGAGWRSVRLPPAGSSTDTSLAGVSCVTSTRCVAVGRSVRSGGPQGFVASLAGTTWTSTLLPLFGPFSQIYLIDVSCTSAQSCVAVGFGYEPGRQGPYVALSYRLAGVTWTGTEAQEVIGNSAFAGVSCAVETSCVAVGSIGDSNGTRSAAQVFDGSTWSLLATPLRTTDEEEWTDVDCAAVSRCVAVGDTHDASDAVTEEPVVTTLVRTTWTRNTVRLVDPTAGGALLGVSCATPRPCTAVGSIPAPAGAPAAPLAVDRAGTGWTGADAIASRSTEFTGVSCLAATCLASGDGGGVAVVAQRSGSGWQDVFVGR